jgi:hypothetical protein
MTAGWAWLVFMRKNVMDDAFQGQFRRRGRQKQTMWKKGPATIGVGRTFMKLLEDIGSVKSFNGPTPPPLWLRIRRSMDDICVWASKENRVPATRELQSHGSTKGTIGVKFRSLAMGPLLLHCSLRYKGMLRQRLMACPTAVICLMLSWKLHGLLKALIHDS